jgi:hypothetical protein
MNRLVAALCVAAAFTGVTAASAPASASAATTVGINTQDNGHFAASPFQTVGFRKVRYIAPWNIALKRKDRGYFARYLADARANGLQVFVTFNAANGSRCPRRPCKLPTVRQYTKAFKAFRRRFRSVRVIAPFNEANHRSQPTFKNPKRAAQYYNVVRKYCRGCTVVAADVIDESNMVRWVKVFKRFARRPRLWGLHNYKDTNPRRGQIKGGTRKLLKTVRGSVWLTETGGIVYFKLPSGGVLFPKNERRASSALKRMFKLARHYRRRIKRVYSYDWSQPRKRNRFDAGLVRKDGSERPGYSTVRKTLAGASFNP